MALREAKYFYVLPCLLGFVLAYVLRVIRWRSLISEIKDVSFLNVFSATSIGFMANHLLPARAGEIVRTVFLGKKENLGMPTIFATIVMERLLDSMSLIILATVTFALIPSLHNSCIDKALALSNIDRPEGLSLQPQEALLIQDSHFLLQLKSGVGILGAICIVSLLFFILLDLYSKQSLDLVRQLFFFMPHKLKEQLIKILESFVLGLRVLKSGWQVLWLAALSFGIWFLFITGIYILGYSFGIKVPFIGMCLVVVCTSLAIALPQAPGYIGVFHLAVLKSLELFHVEASAAQSFAIVLWVLNLFIPLSFGSFFLWREGTGLGQIMKGSSSSEGQA